MHLINILLTTIPRKNNRRIIDYFMFAYSSKMYSRPRGITELARRMNESYQTTQPKS